jgi:hypothetical protein
MNVWAQFKRLLPQTTLQVGEVIEHHADGITSTVELPGGGLIRVRGQDVAVGLNVFVQDGQMLSEAPALTAYDVPV